jgi:hypothetical protein
MVLVYLKHNNQTLFTDLLEHHEFQKMMTESSETPNPPRSENTMRSTLSHGYKSNESIKMIIISIIIDQLLTVDILTAV